MNLVGIGRGTSRWSVKENQIESRDGTTMSAMMKINAGSSMASSWPWLRVLMRMMVSSGRRHCPVLARSRVGPSPIERGLEKGPRARRAPLGPVAGAERTKLRLLAEGRVAVVVGNILVDGLGGAIELGLYIDIPR